MFTAPIVVLPEIINCEIMTVILDKCIIVNISVVRRCKFPGTTISVCTPHIVVTN